MVQRPSDARPRASLSSRVVGAVLRSPIGRRLSRSLVLLRIRGRHSGTLFELPVQVAPRPGGLVVMPGKPETKQWWRNLREPQSIELLRGGTWHRAGAVVVNQGDAEYGAALEAYTERWPRVKVPRGQPLVLVTWLDERDQAAAAS